MSDKQRAEFEKWFTSQIDSEYCSTNVKSLLSECWQAAIASVVVTMPELHDGSNPCRCYYDKDEVEQVLNKAGIRYE